MVLTMTKQTILIIDDDESIGNFEQELLQHSGMPFCARIPARRHCFCSKTSAPTLSCSTSCCRGCWLIY